MTRVIVDANVLASAIAGHPDSPSRRLLEALTADRIQAVLCNRILRELDRALQRPYFAARVTDLERRQADAVLRAAADMFPDPVAPPAVVRDPGDDYLIALAQATRVDAIITGDRDLLGHEGLEPPALTPRAACERFGLS
jgi:uncharacterized protein